MAKIIGLPKLSPTMEEGTLVDWAKKVGDAVDVDDLLAEVETDKATMEFRSFDKGYLLAILVEPGETVAADTPVAIMGDEGEDISALLEQAKSGAPKSGAAKSEPTESKAEPKGSSEAAEPAKEAKPARSSKPAPAAKRVAAGGRQMASPLVRRLAREEGVDLGHVEGTGPFGRIVKRDLDEFLASGGAPASSGAAFERRPPRVEKASQMRKTIARRLVESKQNVPHFYLTIDLDAAPMISAREQMNALLDGEKVSFNDLVIKASAIALRRIPEVNASWMDGEIHYHQVVDMSVAVAVADGLVTPVVRDADRLGVLAISREVKDLAEKARTKKLKPEEMQNGTFSISNLGMYGIEEFAAVINPPEGALLAVGALRDDVGVVGGEVRPVKRMKVTLSCDHRVVDGALGARWLAELKKLLENPMGMLL
ncbi:MAG: pyruvate dehydrogenase complex dihydrolipoamide acetyltransferase [Myxococcales bacterium]|nr:pyruvate dehydrogenase complex dihydrolipoamide acetyltransferase [Myxococcales bacterium]